MTNALVLTIVLTIALTASVAVAGGAADYHEIEVVDGKSLRYALVLPEDFDPTKRYPVLLALPPGPQTEPMVEAGLGRYWGEQAATRGWIVVSPIAPGGTFFHQGSETVIPALLDHIAEKYPIEHDKFHLAGASNGGRSSFRVATLYPDRFLSLTVLPGFPPETVDAARLERIEQLPIAMFVGGEDERWIAAMQRTETDLRALGADVSLTILPGEGHVPPSLDGDVMMEHLERVRAKINERPAGSPPQVQDPSDPVPDP